MAERLKADRISGGVLDGIMAKTWWQKNRVAKPAAIRKWGPDSGRVAGSYGELTGVTEVTVFSLQYSVFSLQYSVSRPAVD